MIDNQKLLQNLIRVEQKLDMIINHFAISDPPRRPIPELEAIAHSKLISLQNRKKSIKNSGHGSPEKIRK